MYKQAPRLWPWFVAVWLVAFVGFHRYETTAFEPGRWPWIYHVHGALLMCWLVLMAAQPILIVNKKTAWHKALGKVSYVLAPCMLLSIWAVAKVAVDEALAEQDALQLANALAGTILPTSVGALFGLFYGLAVGWRQWPEKHKRWMLAASVCVLGPSIARIDYSFLPLANTGMLWAWMLDAIALCFFVYDKLVLKNKGTILGMAMLLIWLDHYAVLHGGDTAAWQMLAKVLFVN